jgi:hypothetical protein
MHNCVMFSRVRSFAKVDVYNAPRFAMSADRSLAEIGDGTISVWNTVTGDRLQMWRLSQQNDWDASTPIIRVALIMPHE